MIRKYPFIFGRLMLHAGSQCAAVTPVSGLCFFVKRNVIVQLEMTKTCFFKRISSCGTSVTVLRGNHPVKQTSQTFITRTLASLDLSMAHKAADGALTDSSQLFKTRMLQNPAMHLACAIS
jgi:hypothetical protein